MVGIVQCVHREFELYFRSTADRLEYILHSAIAWRPNATELHALIISYFGGNLIGIFGKQTALTIAVMHGDIAKVKRYVDAGMDLNKWDSYYTTYPILESVIGRHSNGNLEMVTLLVRTGADLTLSISPSRDNVQAVFKTPPYPLGSSMTALDMAMIVENFHGVIALLVAGSPYDNMKLGMALTNLIRNTVKSFSHPAIKSILCKRIAVVQDFISSPPPLKRLSIHAVRRCIGDGLRDKLSSLHLPPTIRECIMLKDLDDIHAFLAV